MTGRGWQHVNRALELLFLAKTQLFYRLFFGAIGRHSIIRSPVAIVHPENIFIGERVGIRHGCRLEAVVSRFGKNHQPRIVIGDDSSFEQNLHVVCGESVVIGNKVAVTENVGIFDIWHPYQDLTTPIVDQPLRTAPVNIGDETLVGMGAVIQPGVSIGKHCVIGANSVVTRDIPDYAVAVGAPARVIKRYDRSRAAWVKTSS
ncbi:MAG: acyltransferase [Verrucomicrobiia bacterium]